MPKPASELLDLTYRMGDCIRELNHIMNKIREVAHRLDKEKPQDTNDNSPR
jgi:hypothetical protein